MYARKQFQADPETNSRCDSFGQTHWSVVLKAGSGSDPESSEALETLCRTYWYPVYVYLRRRGYEAHTAQDLTQEFFKRLLERNDFCAVSPAKGRFRSFLLASMNHFLANEWRRNKTQKRGGAVHFISLDEQCPESRYARELPDPNAEHAYERHWAVVLLNQAMTRLQAELSAAGKTALFERLKNFLQAQPESGEYAAAAQDLGWAPGAVAVAVHRLRARYGELVLDEIARTVVEPSEIDDEMRRLVAALR